MNLSPVSIPGSFLCDAMIFPEGNRSLGVILYFMLCGFYPFDDQKVPVMFNEIKMGRYTFPSPFWDNISDGAKDYIAVSRQCSSMVSGPHATDFSTFRRGSIWIPLSGSFTWRTLDRLNARGGSSWSFCSTDSF